MRDNKGEGYNELNEFYEGGKYCWKADTPYGIVIAGDDHGNEIFKKIRDYFIHAYEKALENAVSHPLFFEFYGPDRGWIDMRINADGFRDFKYPISQFGGELTFDDIIGWLEKLSEDDCATILLETEDLYLMCTYEHRIGMAEDAGIVVFTQYAEKRRSVYAIMRKRDLIRGIYEALMYFSSGRNVNNPGKDVWWDTASDDEDYNSDDWKDEEDDWDDEEDDWDDEEDEAEEKDPQDFEFKDTTCWEGHERFHQRRRSSIIERYLGIEDA